MTTSFENPIAPSKNAVPLFNNESTTNKTLTLSELVSRYDINGPRYTSYPTAPQFHESFSELSLLNAIARSNQSRRPLSLYFHIPFCDSLCYYCGCNKVVTKNKNRAAPYLKHLLQEIKIQSSLFNHQRSVNQLHWGGGTPTFINNDEMTMLMNSTREHFHLLNNDEGEYSIEIHPGQVTARTMSHIRSLGFNRVSMGIQDFDINVQQAVNRFNKFAEVKALVESLRNDQFKSISMDLIYGLPFQTLESFCNTLDKIIELSPDRLSIFNYAHMPHLFKSQKLINEKDLPNSQVKLAILEESILRLTQAGYIHIGMDHFAKPTDELAKAQAEKKLHRNFQGYTTHGNCDLLAFGVSSISSIDNVYVQNAKSLNEYQKKCEAGLLPYVKGFTLNAEDELRRYIINQLICHFELDFTEVENIFDMEVRTHFNRELKQLTPMIEDGLLEINQHQIKIYNQGRMLIRRICMVFDEYLNQSNQIKFSKII